jgi:hypothetical protein
MSTSASRRPDVEYGLNRPICILLTVFCAALVVLMIVLATTASDQMFAEGLVPGWVFGSFGAVAFSAAGLSWARRLAHSGPRLVLSDAGITSIGFSGTLRWEEIAAASQAKHGSVALRLHDPATFFARQSLRHRVLAWHPSPGKNGLVGVGGIDLASGGDELFAEIQARLDQARLEVLQRGTIKSDVDPPKDGVE